MSLTRKIARPMLAGMFVYGGLDAAKNPDRYASAAGKVVDPLPVDQSTETLVRYNGAVQVGAGSMLALGILPRLSAAALAGTLVPTTLAGHRFWEADDAGERVSQQVHLLKNLSMMGGLLLAATDRRGKSTSRPDSPPRGRPRSSGSSGSSGRRCRRGAGARRSGEAPGGGVPPGGTSTRRRTRAVRAKVRARAARAARATSAARATKSLAASKAVDAARAARAASPLD